MTGGVAPLNKNILIVPYEVQRPKGKTMKNQKSRHQTIYVGPRQSQILLRLKTHGRQTLKELTQHAGVGGLTMQIATLIQNGFILSDTSKAKVASDGVMTGIEFYLTIKGVALARRLQKVDGLGRTFGVTLRKNK